jgi:RNA polymerase sigma-70 factor (ECF subfamily)
MNEENWLAEQFEENRCHLQAVAYRMLGTRSEAEDAVQEAWLRLARSDAQAVANLGGWLTTVVARICLDMLRSRKSRREEPLDMPAHGDIADGGSADPEREAMVTDSVGTALIVILQTLSPAERVAFVLHDMFDLPFDEIAPIVGRSAAATRQLASRARRRVQGQPEVDEIDVEQRRHVVDAFLAAARTGDFPALLAALAPDVVFRADPTAVAMGASAEIRGAEAVAETFRGRAQGARPAFFEGGVGFVVLIAGKLRVVLKLVFEGDRIAAIDAIADPTHLGTLDYRLLAD